MKRIMNQITFYILQVQIIVIVTPLGLLRAPKCQNRVPFLNGGKTPSTKWTPSHMLTFCREQLSYC